MKRHLISEKMVKQLSNSIILVFSITFSFFIFSCKSKLSYSDGVILQMQDSINVRECTLNEPINKIVENSIDEFEAKVHKSPTVILLDFFKENNVVKFSLISEVNLYTKKSDMLFYNPSYYSGCTIGKTLVLVKQNENTELLAEKYIKLKSDSGNFKIYYGGDMSNCEKIFRILPEKFDLELYECPSSIHTD